MLVYEYMGLLGDGDIFENTPQVNTNVMLSCVRVRAYECVCLWVWVWRSENTHWLLQLFYYKTHLILAFYSSDLLKHIDDKRLLLLLFIHVNFYTVGCNVKGKRCLMLKSVYMNQIYIWSFWNIWSNLNETGFSFWSVTDSKTGQSGVAEGV